jgi:NAD(P)-dependent dehydrogenase (short-subunit alcohol dehydrogenase family)
VADVAEPEAIKQAIDAIATHYGRLDGLVNNAGVARPDPLEAVSAADFAMQWAVNVGGVLWASQAALPWLRKSDNPRIVTITSASARHNDEMAHLGVYASTKAAAERMTFELREELKGEGIAVTAVSPGFAATDFAAGWDFAKLQKAAAVWRKRSPEFYEGMGVDDIGAAVAHCFGYPRGVAVDFIEVRPNRPVTKPEF